MKLSGASKRVLDLWRSGWDIHINRDKRYAYMTKGGLFRRIRYRDALKAMAARKAEEKQEIQTAVNHTRLTKLHPEHPPKKQRIWTP